MRVKIVNPLIYFRSNFFMWIFLFWCVPKSSTTSFGINAFPGSAVSSGSGVLTFIVAAFHLSHAQGSTLIHSPILNRKHKAESPSTFRLAKNAIHNARSVSLPVRNSPKLKPTGLKQLPKSFRSSRLKNKGSRSESSLKRVKLLLESLNRQNCFAKVLCGLEARPSSIKKDLLNDYAYLMKELVVNENDELVGRLKEPKPYLKESKDHRNILISKRKDKDEQEIYVPNEDSESSQSNSDELSDDEKGGALRILGDSKSEDPEVLKYLQLEQLRRKYKQQVPKSTLPFPSLFKRWRRSRNLNNSKYTVGFSDRQHMQQKIRPVDNGNTFRNTPQCSQKFDRCPFDDKEMDEIVANLKKMLESQTKSVSQAPGTYTIPQGLLDESELGPDMQTEIISATDSEGSPQSETLQSPQVQSETPSNLQKLPESNLKPLSQPISKQSLHSLITSLSHSNHTQPMIVTNSFHNNVTQEHSQSNDTLPQTQQPIYIIQTDIETTIAPQTDGEKQLMEYLYGVENFNHSDSSKPEVQNEQANIFWSIVNSHSPDDDESSEEIEPLQRTPQGFSQLSTEPLTYGKNKNEDFTSTSSEEEDYVPEPFGRREHFDVDSLGKKNMEKSKPKKFKTDPFQSKLGNAYREMPTRPLIAIPYSAHRPIIKLQRNKGPSIQKRTGALIAVPYQQPYHPQLYPQHVEGNFDFLGSVFEMMGMNQANHRVRYYQRR